MYASHLQNILVWFTIFSLPGQLLAQDAGVAMLYGDDVSVNNNVIPKSVVIFPGDVLLTKNGIASLVDTGSSATVDINSLIDYQKNSLKLEHGQLQVATSVGMAVRVGCVVVTPAEEVMTKFEVRDLDGKILIDAQKGDLIISEDKRHERLPEGQEGTRHDEKCRAGAGAMSAVNQGILDSTTAKILGSGVVGGILIWLLTDESGTPLSGWQP
ncbi:MAG TPA: hypothetical protein VFA74_20445 [Terriglobales bacterium]|nr:hypothetical protein [Terriglobales bacterium]